MISGRSAYPSRRASQPLPEFPERADAQDIRGSRDRLAAVYESLKRLEIVHFHEGHSGSVVHATHDRGIVTWWQIRDDC
jgi:hypothetical protein